MHKCHKRGTIITPENDKLIENFVYENQVEWENEGLTKSDLIAFWVPRNLENMPAFTTNVEFGEWMKSGKVVLGYPDDAEKMTYLNYKANKFGIPVFNSTDSLCRHIIKTLK